jgi:hypothetical protein
VRITVILPPPPTQTHVPFLASNTVLFTPALAAIPQGALLTQLAAEALVENAPPTNTLLSQVAPEVVTTYQVTSETELSQVAIEVLIQGPLKKNRFRATLV